MLLSEAIEDISAVKPRVVSKLSRNKLKPTRERMNDKLQLPLNLQAFFAQVARHFHLHSATA
jgi:hypothetical protein